MASKKNRRKERDQQAPRRPRLVDPGWRDRHFIRKTISLNTPEAKALANSIPFVSSAACIIGFALQRYVEDIRVLSLLESVDEEIFKTLGNDLENECKRLETLVSEEGVKRVTEFPNPVKVDVDINHPFGLEYARMVENMDKLVILLCDLEMARIINDVELGKARNKWYQLIREASFRISKLAKDTLNQAKQERNEKEAAASKEAETTAAVSESPDSQPTETAESPASEIPETQETVAGGNGRRNRKVGKTAAAAPEAEEGQGTDLEPTGPADESFPPLQQVV